MTQKTCSILADKSPPGGDLPYQCEQNLSAGPAVLAEELFSHVIHDVECSTGEMTTGLNRSESLGNGACRVRGDALRRSELNEAHACSASSDSNAIVYGQNAGDCTLALNAENSPQSSERGALAFVQTASVNSMTADGQNADFERNESTHKACRISSNGSSRRETGGSRTKESICNGDSQCMSVTDNLARAFEQDVGHCNEEDPVYYRSLVSSGDSLRLSVDGDSYVSINRSTW